MPKFNLKRNFNKELDDKQFMQNNSESLRERFTDENTAEVKVENRFTGFLGFAWNLITTLIGGGLAVIGVIALITPELRTCFTDIFLQFFEEIGMF